MMRKPTFFNPFSRGARQGDAVDTVLNDTLGLLDPGLSQCPACNRPLEPGNHSTEPSVHHASVAVGASYLDLQAATTSAHAAPRKGSLHKVKSFARRLLPRTRRESNSSADMRPQSPVHSATRSSAPPRPTRPQSIDLELLDFMGQYSLSNLQAPRSSLRPMDVAHPAVDDIAVLQQTVDVPEVSVQDNAGPDPSKSLPPPPSTVSLSLLSPPLSSPSSGCSPSFSLSPSPRTSSPPSEQEQDGELSNSGKLERIGVCSQRPIYTLQNPGYWTVTQKNNVRVPDLRVSKWVTGGVLGSGGFGRVYLVFNVGLQAECAMKVVHLARGITESACQGLISELRVLKTLGCERQQAPFLLQPFLCDELWAWHSRQGYLHILTEVCSGGTLTSYKGKLPFQSLVLVCAEMILGISHLHRHGIVHHDLKPSNVFVNAAGHCVIGDYGGARFLNERGKLVPDKEKSAIMTVPFAAPEALQVEDLALGEYDERADWWSLGATVVSMLMGDEFLPGTTDLPFMTYRVKKIQDQMAKMGLPLDLQAFVLELLQMDPAQRLIYPAIKTHCLFHKINWNEVLAQKRPAIPIVKELVTSAHGWTYETPKAHGSRDARADFLVALRQAGLFVYQNDSYDVELHHAAMSSDI